jgi:hypothetical protein
MRRPVSPLTESYLKDEAADLPQRSSIRGMWIRVGWQPAVNAILCPPGPVPVVDERLATARTRP